MNKYLSGFSILCLLLVVNTEVRAANGDYRTKASGTWNDPAIWQVYQSGWQDATNFPTYSDGNIDIRSTHTVWITADITLDETSVNSGGILYLNAGVILTLNQVSTTELSVIGTMYVNGTIYNYGEMSGSGNIYFNNGSLYRHYKNGGALPHAAWYSVSTCEIVGCTSSTVTNLDQEFWNFTWNCGGQNDFFNFNVPDPWKINGDFSIQSTGTGVIELTQSGSMTMKIGGNYNQSNGIFDPAYSTGHDTITIGGNFTFSNGTISCPGSGCCTFRFNTNGATQTYTKTGGNYYQKINFEVTNGSTLDMGSSIIENASTGYFTLNPYCGIKTMHSQGVSTTASTGCVQLQGTKTYSTYANYFYYNNGSQSSGNGFPTSLNGTVTVGTTSNSTNLSLTNGSVTVNNKLTLVSSSSVNSSISGTVSYGSGGTLEYKGGIGQTAASSEWPTSSGPPNVIINNSNNVSLPASFSRTITGTLYLTSGALSIGSNLLTFNNGAISRTSGSLTGGSSSSITFSGTGSTSLPGVLNGLKMLTMNRSSSTITMTGNVLVNDTLILTNGSFALSGGAISYGSNGTLKYNSSSAQTTANAEFPVSNGPKNLYIKNPAGVNLHAGRSLDGTLYLNSGTFSIGSGNTLTLNKDINVVSGSLTGGSSSNVTFGEYTSATTLPSVTNGLNNLTINRAAGINLGASLTLAGTLALSAGPLSIGATTLTLNGLLTKTSGSLTGGLNSNIIAGGTSVTALDLPQVSLNNLTMNRSSSGIRQIGDITINGIMTMTSGSLNNNGWVFQYGSGGTLNYNGTSAQTTTNNEFPASSGPYNLYIDNAVSVGLHADRTIGGTLTLNSGQFLIGAHTLTLNGGITQNPPASLTGGTSSNITFGDNVSSTNLPSVQLNDLRIHRSSGIGLSGNVTTEGTLYLELGSLSIGSTTLTVNGAISLSSGSLLGGGASNMIFGGSGSWTYLPSVTLNDLEINRSSGIKMSGQVTIEDNLSLTNGAFSIESNTLNIDGTINYSGGSLSGGTSSDLTFGGSGASTNLNAVTLHNLTINRAAGIGLGGDVSTLGTLYLTSGNLGINANTLTVNGDITNSSSPGLIGGSSSNVIFGGSGSSTNLPSVTLNDLTINRAAGIGLGGSVSLEGTLSLTSGDLSINANTLTINGDIVYNSNLVGSSMSNMIFGGSGSAGSLQSISLSMLTLNRSSGLDLTDSITVYNQFTLMDGQIRRNGFRLYGTSTMLRYNYSSTHLTSDEELPDTKGPLNIMMDMMNNSDKMNLHGSKTVNGDLILSRGILSIGAHTLTLNGMVMPGMGSFEGGISSNIIFGGVTGGTAIPSVTLNDLTINRPMGIVMNGDVTLFGTLILTAGNFNVNSSILELNGGPISGTLSNLQTSITSGLYFGGNASGITIPSVVMQLGKLKAANPNGVEMTNNLFVTSSVLVSKWLKCADKVINGPGVFIMESNSKLSVGHPFGVSGNISMAGPKMINSDTDFEFYGKVNQQTHFLPTMIPNTIRNLIINNSNNAVVTLTDNMTFIGNVDVLSQSSFKVDVPIQCEVQGDVIIHAE
ncbi:MAG: hypothetical protein NTX61_12585 [Bacteroidetes bacterium]|nr:hypothetical protein [Bacteroidota bacterium]